MALFFTLGAFATLLVAVRCDAPLSSGGGYSYNRPSSSFSGGSFGGYQSGGAGGYPSSGGGYSSGGGSYVPVQPGPSTYEGQYVDQKLLEQIRQVILRDEGNSQSSGGYSSSGGYPSSSYGAPSSSYGAPSSSYGAPSLGSGGGYSSRVVGIDLEGVKPAIQIAQYEHTGSSGYSGSGVSSNYGAPSLGGSSFGGGFSSLGGSYGAPSRQPSSSYGTPF